MPSLSTLGLVSYPLSYGLAVTKSTDQGWCEYLGAQGIYSSIIGLTRLMQVAQNNSLKVYLTSFILIVTFLLLLN